MVDLGKKMLDVLFSCDTSKFEIGFGGQEASINDVSSPKVGFGAEDLGIVQQKNQQACLSKSGSH